jgi:1,4-dihydroxy-2-naphthoyl-CoA synthase
VTEWQRSGPQPGKDYSGSARGAAGGVATIAISRRQVRTAFRPTALFGLSPAVTAARHDPGSGVIILTGAGFSKFPRRP